MEEPAALEVEFPYGIEDEVKLPVGDPETVELEDETPLLE